MSPLLQLHAASPADQWLLISISVIFEEFLLVQLSSSCPPRSRDSTGLGDRGNALQLLQKHIRNVVDARSMAGFVHKFLSEHSVCCQKRMSVTQIINTSNKVNDWRLAALYVSDSDRLSGVSQWC